MSVCQCRRCAGTGAPARHALDHRENNSATKIAGSCPAPGHGLLAGFRTWVTVPSRVAAWRRSWWRWPPPAPSAWSDGSSWSAGPGRSTDHPAPGRPGRPRHRRRRPDPHHCLTRPRRQTGPALGRPTGRRPSTRPDHPTGPTPSQPLRHHPDRRPYPATWPGPRRQHRRHHRHRHQFHVHTLTGQTLAVIPRTTSKDVTRFKAPGWRDR